MHPETTREGVFWVMNQGGSRPSQELLWFLPISFSPPLPYHFSLRLTKWCRTHRVLILPQAINSVSSPWWRMSFLVWWSILKPQDLESPRRHTLGVPGREHLDNWVYPSWVGQHRSMHQGPRLLNEEEASMLCSPFHGKLCPLEMWAEMTCQELYPSNWRSNESSRVAA